MATSNQIFNVRLRIDDPSGFIQFIEVADTASLPAEPSSQSAYKVLTNGNYVATELETGATPSDYEVQELRVSDVRIGAWIDEKGEDYAVCKSIEAIIAKLGNELAWRKNSAGAEDVEYNSLKDTYDYYNRLYSACKEDNREVNKNSTGRWGGSKKFYAGGGNL